MKIQVLIAIICLLFNSIAISGQNRISGTRGKVTDVLSGNTIRLDKGLKVVLYGIDDNPNGKKYLETQVKGKTVVLVADSRDPEQTYRSSQATVRAYVRMLGQSGSVNGRMLSTRMADLSIGSMKDSLLSYKALASSVSRPRLSKEELLVKLKSAAFCICTESGMGTGFFIGDDGLALTNNHVLDGSEHAIAYMFGEDGEIDKYNSRNIEQIILTYPGQNVDFTIFRVRLNPGERSAYLPIANHHANEGEDVAKIGCPLGEIANFQIGIISNYKYDDDGCYLIHSIPTNNGDSGGPVVNCRGEVIGINQSVRVNQNLSTETSLVLGQGLSYAVDVVQIAEWLKGKGIVYGK